MAIDLLDALEKAISGEENFLDSIEKQQKEEGKTRVIPLLELEVFMNVLLNFLDYKGIVNKQEYIEYKKMFENNIRKQVEERYDKMIEEEIKKEIKKNEELFN